MAASGEGSIGVRLILQLCSHGGRHHAVSGRCWVLAPRTTISCLSDPSSLPWVRTSTAATCKLVSCLPSPPTTGPPEGPSQAIVWPPPASCWSPEVAPNWPGIHFWVGHLKLLSWPLLAFPAFKQHLPVAKLMHFVKKISHMLNPTAYHTSFFLASRSKHHSLKIFCVCSCLMAFLPELSSAWNVFLLMFTRSFSFHVHFIFFII